MKYNFGALILIFNINVVFAQSLDIKSAIWHAEATSSSGQIFNDIYYQKDSVINGKSYLHFTASQAPNLSSPIRIDSNKVFVFDGVEDVLLYDWSLTSGDSIKWFGEGLGSVYFYIDSITTIVINGKSRRAQIGRFLEYNIKVIENVGIEFEDGYFNIIYPIDRGRAILLGGIANFCSYESNGQLYQPFKKYNCDPLSNLGIEKLNEIKVFPNPVRDFLNIVSEKDYNHSHLLIYNVYGQNVLNGVIENSTIDVSLLNPGIYYIIFEEKNIILNFMKY